MYAWIKSGYGRVCMDSSYAIFISICLWWLLHATLKNWSWTRVETRCVLYFFHFEIYFTAIPGEKNKLLYWFFLIGLSWRFIMHKCCWNFASCFCGQTEGPGLFYCLKSSYDEACLDWSSLDLGKLNSIRIRSNWVEWGYVSPCRRFGG